MSPPSAALPPARGKALGRLRLGLLALALAALARPAATTLVRWFSLSPAEVLGTDFTRYVASARMGLQFGWNHLYDPEAQRAVASQLGDLFWLPNVYTPAMSLLMVPLTWLSIPAGYAVWSAVQLGCLLLCWRLIAPGDAPQRTVLLAMTFVPYPVFLGLLQGQVIPLQMALVAGSYVLLQREHHLLSGLLLCGLVLKPQGLQLLPLALLVAGRRRAFLGWLAGMVAIGCGVLLAIGIDGARSYAERLVWAGTHSEALWVAWSYTYARHFPAGWMRTAALAAAVMVTLVASFRQRQNLAVVFSAGLVGSILASPYMHLYDFMLLFPAAWFLLRGVPLAWAAPPLLACYVFLLYSDHAGKGPRWIVLCECVWVAALALLPPASLAPRRGQTPGTAGPGEEATSARDTGVWCSSP